MGGHGEVIGRGQAAHQTYIAMEEHQGGGHGVRGQQNAGTEQAAQEEEEHQLVPGAKVEGGGVAEGASQVLPQLMDVLALIRADGPGQLAQDDLEHVPQPSPVGASLDPLLVSRCVQCVCGFGRMLGHEALQGVKHFAQPPHLIRDGIAPVQAMAPQGQARVVNVADEVAVGMRPDPADQIPVASHLLHGALLGQDIGRPQYIIGELSQNRLISWLVAHSGNGCCRKVVWKDQ